MASNGELQCRCSAWPLAIANQTCRYRSHRRFDKFRVNRGATRPVWAVAIAEAQRETCGKWNADHVFSFNNLNGLVQEWENGGIQSCTTHCCAISTENKSTLINKKTSAPSAFCARSISGEHDDGGCHGRS